MIAMLLPRVLTWLLLVLVTVPAVAQESLEDALERDQETRLLSRYGDDPRAFQALEALDGERFIRARELATEILEDDPLSFAGHCLMGLVQHIGEGNLPIAFFHLKKARELFEARFSSAPGDGAPWFWHAISITQMAYVSGEMGRHRDKIRLLEEHDELYSPPRPADRGWPLMRLRDYDGARLAAQAGIATENQNQIATALTVLCAVEAEQQFREAGYEACLEAAKHDRDNLLGNPTPFTNASEASLGMLRFAEAEKMLNEASGYFVRGTPSNPYLDLTLLYLASGRTAEALEAVREMFTWRNRQPPYMDEQNRAETELTSALFLLIAGHAGEAAALSTRTLDRPDRTGFTSSESEQLQAAAALVDRMTHRTAAETWSEAASWLPWDESIQAHLRSAGHRLRAWSSGRRAAAWMVNDRMLAATLRPYLAGGVEAPEWVEPELIELLGPGVVTAALDIARREETLPEAEGYFLAAEAEVAVLEGQRKRALELTDRALQTLPQSEVLLRARLLVLAAQSARAGGNLERSVEFFDLAMQIDPGAVRRQGASLPTVFYEAPGPVAAAAADHLRGSPRFSRSRGGGFQVRVEGDAQSGAAFLLNPSGAVLASAQVTPRAGDTVETLGRRLAQELHEVAFAPKLDLTQADLRTLDGSPTAAGGRSRERLRSVLDEVVQETDQP